MKLDKILELVKNLADKVLCNKATCILNNLDLKIKSKEFYNFI